MPSEELNEDPAKTLAPPKRRRQPRLRFSLRTLLLFVILIASGATLWWNWGPWKMVFELEAPASIEEIFFSEDGQFVMFEYAESHAATHNWNSTLDVRFTANGKQQTLLKNPNENAPICIVGDYALLPDRKLGEYVMRSPRTDISQLAQVVNYRTREPLRIAGLFESDRRLFEMSMSKHFLLLRKETFELRRLPDFAPVEMSIPAETVSLDAIDKLVIDYKTSLEIRDLNTGAIVRTAAFESDDTGWTHVHPNTIVHFNPAPGHGVFSPLFNVRVFNAHSGALLLNTTAVYGDYVLSTDERFIQLHHDNNDQGVHELPSGKTVAGGNYWMTRDAALLVGTDSVRKTKTLTKLWDRNGAFLFVSPDSSVAAVSNEKRFYLANARTGAIIMKCPQRISEDSQQMAFAHQSLDFVLLSDSEAGSNTFTTVLPPQELKHATFWHLTRPWQWYGVAWMPEFWMTIVLAMGLIWSVWRD